jgi:hypothetical protein
MTQQQYNAKKARLQAIEDYLVHHSNGQLEREEQDLRSDIEEYENTLSE